MTYPHRSCKVLLQFVLGERERDVSPGYFSGFHYHEPGVLTQVSGASPFLQGAPPCPLALEKGKQSAECFSAKGLRRLGFVHKASGSCISFY